MEDWFDRERGDYRAGGKRRTLSIHAGCGGTSVTLSIEGDVDLASAQWTVSPTGSSTDPVREADGNWTTTPLQKPESGIITYTLSSGASQGVFQLQVVDQVELSDGTHPYGGPGDKVELTVAWPAGTAASNDYQYRWRPIDGAVALNETN